MSADLKNSGKGFFLLVAIMCFSLMGLAQNVGIGTNSPQSKLHVAGCIRSDTLIGMGVRNLFAAPNGRIYDSLVAPPALSWEIGGNNNITSTNFLGTTNANDVIFKTNSVERARILSTGNMGIGTATPNNMLEITSTAANASGLRFTNLTSASNTVTANGKSLSVDVNGDVVLVPSSADAWLLNGNTGTTAGTNFLGTTDVQDLVFKTNSTEYMRIMANGNTGIGIVNPAVNLEVNSRARISSSNPLLELNGTFAPVPNLASIAIRSAGELVHRTNTNNAAIADWEMKYGTGTYANPNDVFYIGRRPDPASALNFYMLINNIGNVGIGTTAPANKLELTSAAANTSGLRFTNLTASSTTVAANGKSLSVNASGDVILVPSSADAWLTSGNAGTSAGTNFLGTTDAQDMVFKTNNTENMRIVNTNGRVGINYTAPLSKLTIQDRFDGNYANLNPVSALVGMSIYDNTDFVGMSTEDIDGNLATTDDASGLIYWGDNGNEKLNFKFFQFNGSSFTPNTIATMLSNGDVGIGTASPTALLHLNQATAPSSQSIFTKQAATYVFENFIGTTFNGYTNSTGILYQELNGAETYMFGGEIVPDNDGMWKLGAPTLRWNTVYASNGTINTSDSRLKKDIQPVTYGLKEVMQLQAIEYNWKDEKLNNGIAQKKLGFLAQDLEKIIPNVVYVPKAENEYYGVDYQSLIPVLTKAIQEQQKEIDALKEENNRIRQQQADLLNQMNKK